MPVPAVLLPLLTLTWIGRWLQPDLIPPPLLPRIADCRDMQSSPYTMTKDGYFVLDKLPGRPEVCMFTGGNGRAFKFAPLIGR